MQRFGINNGDDHAIKHDLFERNDASDVSANAFQLLALLFYAAAIIRLCNLALPITNTKSRSYISTISSATTTASPFSRNYNSARRFGVSFFKTASILNSANGVA